MRERTLIPRRVEVSYGREWDVPQNARDIEYNWQYDHVVITYMELQGNSIQ